MEDTLGSTIAVLFAGEREEWALWPKACESRSRGRRPRESRSAMDWKVQGELGNGARALGGIGLSNRCIHELTTQGVRAKRSGIMHV